MNAALKNIGRSEVRERIEEQANRRDNPRVRFSIFPGQDDRTAEQRRADLDAEARRLGVARMCFV